MVQIIFSIENDYSDPGDLNGGVSQGSILRPLPLPNMCK